MTLFPIFLMLFAAGFPNSDQSFRLEPGDFRWIPFTVRQTPTGIDCRFAVVKGGPTVHAELLPMSEFRLFDRGREHETLALTANARVGEFRRVIDVRGQYAVVVVNDRNAAPAMVSLQLETTLNPGAGEMARTLSPQRRFTVVLISLAFFLAALTWSSRRLIGAMRRGSREP